MIIEHAEPDFDRVADILKRARKQMEGEQEMLEILLAIYVDLLTQEVEKLSGQIEQLKHTGFFRAGPVKH